MTIKEKNLFKRRGNPPKYKINPFMQMCRYILALQSHPMLMYEIYWVFGPRRKSDRIWYIEKYQSVEMRFHFFKQWNKLLWDTYRAFPLIVLYQSRLNFHWSKSQGGKTAREPKIHRTYKILIPLFNNRYKTFH